MFIFRQSMKKMLTSWSTWIILGVAVLLVAILAGTYTNRLIKHITHIQKNLVGTQVQIKVFWMIVGFISIFASIFTGFKSVQLIRSEIEDGTLLLILSKPIPRHILILQKWLSIVVINLIFSFSVFFILLLYFAITPSTFPSSLNTFSPSNYLKVSFAFWGILFLLMMLFSASSILFSMFFSSAITIGASIAVSILIPILSIVSSFSISRSYKSIATQIDKPLSDYVKAKLFLNSLDGMTFSDKDDLDEEVKGNIKDNLEEMVKLNSRIEDIYSTRNVGELALDKTSNPYSRSWFLNPQEIISTMFYGAIRPAESITNQIENYRQLFINPGEAHVTMQWVKDGGSQFNNANPDEKVKMYYREYLRTKDLRADLSISYIKLLLAMNEHLSERILELKESGNTRIIIDSDFQPPESEIANYYPIPGNTILSSSQSGFSINNGNIYTKLQKLDYDQIQHEKIYFIKKVYWNSLLIAGASIRTEHSREIIKRLVNDLNLKIQQPLIDFLNLDKSKIDAGVIQKMIEDNKFINIDFIKNLLHRNHTNKGMRSNDLVHQIRSHTIWSLYAQASIFLNSSKLAIGFYSNNISEKMRELATMLIRSWRYSLLFQHDPYLMVIDDIKAIEGLEYAKFQGEDLSRGINEWFITDKLVQALEKDIHDGRVDEIKATPYAKPENIIYVTITITLILMSLASLIMMRKNYR